MYSVRAFGPEDSLYKLERSINSFIANREVINVSLAEGKGGYSAYYTAIVLYKV